MSVGWNHAICCDCWLRRNMHDLKSTGDLVEGKVRIPVRYVPRDRFNVALCCFCDRATCAGIFIRMDPECKELHCPGHRSEDKDKEHYDFLSVPINLN